MTHFSRAAASFFIRFWSLALVITFYFGQVPPQVRAQECEEINCSQQTQSTDDYLSCNREKQQCLESKIRDSQQAATTLKNTLSIINGQISLQQLQIDQSLAEIKRLENEVAELSTRINGLSMSLDRLTNVLIERIRANYKQSRTNAQYALVSSDSFGDLLTQVKYLSIAQQQTASAMHKTETQRLVYDEQKHLKEQKQEQLEAKQVLLQQQQTKLNQQKAEQQYLLTETQNNEARYQKELAQTLAEVEAIQSIIAGRGTESEAKKVKQGDTIASVIAGPSACSTGAHLHFEVVKDNAHRNPADYLKSTDISWHNSPDDSFGFGGSWEWPVNNAALVTQGYGMTYYARVKRFYGGSPHTGIDMLSKTSGDYAVKAVKDGTLFRGSIKCGGGYLRYVKVEHEEGGVSTYYLHVNY